MKCSNQSHDSVSSLCLDVCKRGVGLALGFDASLMNGAAGVN